MDTTWERLLAEGSAKQLPTSLKFKAEGKMVQVGETFELSIPVNAEGSILKYWFKTDGLDIGFEVILNTDVNSAVVVPYERVESHVEVVQEEKGPFAIESGALVLRWDNSYSWLRGKRLTYSVELEYPDDATILKSEVTHDRRNLQSCLEDMTRAKRHMVRTQRACISLEEEMTALEERLTQLKLDLVAKHQSYESAVTESDWLVRRLASQKNNVVHLVLALVLRDGWLDLGSQPAPPLLASKVPTAPKPSPVPTVGDAADDDELKDLEGQGASSAAGAVTNAINDDELEDL